jgi:O-antigen/teichoic acid export membrane protein
MTSTRNVFGHRKHGKVQCAGFIVPGGWKLPEIRHKELSNLSRTEVKASSPLHTREVMQRLINQVAGYGVGAVINRGLGIVVAGIYPVLLSKDEYGRLDVIFSLIALLSVMFCIGLDSALSRYYYEQKETVQRRRLVSTVFYTVMTFTLSTIAVLLLVSRPLSLWLYEDPRYTLYFRLMLCGMPFAMGHSVSMTVLRLEHRIRTYNILMVANLVIAAISGILSILLLHLGTAGVLVGFITGYIVTSFASMWLIRREITSVPMRGHMGKLLSIGLPLVISGIATWLISYVNRPILVHRVQAEDLGLYAIASGVVGMIILLFGSFQNAWQPFAFSIMGREGSGKICGQALTLFTALGAFVAVCAGVFSPFALLILNAYTHKDWSGAAPAIGPLAMGAVFSTMYFVVQTGAYIVRRTSVIAITMGIAAFVNIMLNFIFIPSIGIMGAAFATALGDMTALIAVYLVAQRLAPISYHPGKLILTILTASAAIAAASFFQPEALIQHLLVKAIILLAFCSVLWASRIITSGDLLLFRNINWMGRKTARPVGNGETGQVCE